MSDTVLSALIGVGGTVVGAVATILVARIQASHKAAPSMPSEKVEGIPLSSLDIRELRILRALFGEAKGRKLEAYQDAYYGPALQAVVKRGLVKQLEKRFFMTPKGAAFCRAYLKKLFERWQPEAQILA